jgi:hypothetical protein
MLTWQGLQRDQCRTGISSAPFGRLAHRRRLAQSSLPHDPPHDAGERMTEPDLRSQLVSIETSQRHIMEQLRDAADHRKERDRDIVALATRVTILETGGKALDGLPEQVRENAMDNAIQEALARQHGKFMEDFEARAFKIVGTGVVVLGLVLSAATFAANYFVNGG